MKIEIGKIYVHHKKWWNQPYCVENHFDQKVKVLKKTKCNGRVGYLVQGVQDEWHKNTKNMDFEQRFVHMLKIYMKWEQHSHVNYFRRKII